MRSGRFIEPHPLLRHRRQKHTTARPATAPTVSISTSVTLASREATNDWCHPSLAAKRTVSPRAKAASDQRQGRGSPRLGLRRTRQISQAKTAYSVKCAVLRTRYWTVLMVSWDTFGLSQRNSGTRSREVYRGEPRFVEKQKINR